MTDGRGVAAVVATRHLLAALPTAVRLLTDVEKARAAAFRRPGDRDDYIAAHALVRLCAQLAFGTPADVPIVQRCTSCGGPHGRPVIEGQGNIHLSLAHSTGVVAGAAGPSPVGVDVERLDLLRDDPEVRAAVTMPAERAQLDVATEPLHAFGLLWVRKEALVKLGVMPLDAMREVDLSGLPPDPPARGGRTTPGSRVLPPPRWNSFGSLTLTDVVLAEPMAIGCVASRGGPRLVSLADLSAEPGKRSGWSRGIPRDQPPAFRSGAGASAQEAPVSFSRRAASASSEASVPSTSSSSAAPDDE